MCAVQFFESWLCLLFLVAVGKFVQYFYSFVPVEHCLFMKNRKAKKQSFCELIGDEWCSVCCYVHGLLFFFTVCSWQRRLYTNMLKCTSCIAMWTTTPRCIFWRREEERYCIHYCVVRRLWWACIEWHKNKGNGALHLPVFSSVHVLIIYSPQTTNHLVI